MTQEIRYMGLLDKFYDSHIVDFPTCSVSECFLSTSQLSPPLPPPIVFPTTSLIIDGPVSSGNGKSNSKTGCSAQLPTIPCWFDHWGTGNPAGPSVTNNSGKDHGFTVLRSGSPRHVSFVQVYPQILATAAHSLK